MSVPPYRPADDVGADIAQWQEHMQQTPEDREQTWIEQNLHPKGLSADKVTREIFDSQGRVVGTLPDFR